MADRTLDSRTSWEANYDEWDMLEDGRDARYFFELQVEVDGSRETLASSLFFNVTAPKKENTRTITAPPSTVTISQSRLIESEETSTAESLAPVDTATGETKSARKEQDSSSTYGMSQGEVAGAAVGGVVGGLLLFGVIGWVLWKWMARNKSHPADTAVNQYQEQAVETKAELPGDNRVHPSEYARSPTGVYEAP